MSKVRFTLYVLGATALSRRAVANIETLCERLSDYELNVVDLLENPGAAEANRVLATPLLVKELPPPRERIVGDLSQIDEIVYRLNLDLSPSPTTDGTHF